MPGLLDKAFSRCRPQRNAVSRWLISDAPRMLSKALRQT
ncbi:hypothetical protein MRBBS_0213 [Marinobacter sp. BSs20148]|nr:hypothetical protein MRBBS_0213 [Marinobacter sp. BSs20148]